MNSTAPSETKQDTSSEEGLAGFAKNTSVWLRAPEAILKTGGVVIANVANTSAGWVPFVGDATKTVANAANVDMMKGAIEGATKITGVDQVLAGVTAGSHLIGAVGELAQGDTVGAAGKTVRGATEGAAVLLSLTGPLGIAAELVAKVTTGKFIATHAGDLAEGAVTGMLGGTKEEKEAKQQHVRPQVSNPAAAVMIPAGVATAGLTAQQFATTDGQKISVGTLPGNRTPDGKELGSIELNSLPVIAGQVMDATYAPQRAQTVETEQQAYPAQDRDKNFWRDKVLAEGKAPAQQHMNNNGIQSDPPIFMDAISKAQQFVNQREETGQQGLTATR